MGSSFEKTRKALVFRGFGVRVSGGEGNASPQCSQRKNENLVGDLKGRFQSDLGLFMKEDSSNILMLANRSTNKPAEL